MLPSTGSPPRVLHLITSTERRGAEVFAVALSDELTRMGFDSRVVALAPGASPNPDLRVPVLAGRARSLRSVYQVRRLAGRCDVVVAHGSSTLPVSSVALVAHRTRIVYRSIGDPGAWVTSWARRQRVRMMLRRADAVVALWPAAAEQLQRAHGLDASSLSVIPNGADPERFAPGSPQDRLQARRNLGVKGDGPVVAFVGALSEEKRLEDAITAVEAITGATLLVAGAGAPPARLPPHVHLLGAQGDPRPVYWAADALVLTSRTEGMPAAVIEAAMCGVPVVSTDVGAVSELVVPGTTGFIVSVGDVDGISHHLRLALDGREELGAAARQHAVERYSIKGVAASWASLVRQVHAVG